MLCCPSPVPAGAQLHPSVPNYTHLRPPSPTRGRRHELVPDLDAVDLLKRQPKTTPPFVITKNNKAKQNSRRTEDKTYWAKYGHLFGGIIRSQYTHYGNVINTGIDEKSSSVVLRHPFNSKSRCYDVTSSFSLFKARCSVK